MATLPKHSGQKAHGYYSRMTAATTERLRRLLAQILRENQLRLRCSEMLREQMLIIALPGRLCEAAASRLDKHLDELGQSDESQTGRDQD